jgi:hypothetical protein
MTGSGRRPKLPVASAEMKAWSAALAAEVSGWPQVSTRSFFGFTALYRRGKIFALLPRTRGMKTSNSLAFRLETRGSALQTRLAKDPRIASTRMQKARWFTFEISSGSDLHHALDWLGAAYDEAGKRRRLR